MYCFHKGISVIEISLISEISEIAMSSIADKKQRVNT